MQLALTRLWERFMLQVMHMKEAKGEQQSYHVPMVDRVLSVFEAFQARGSRLFMTEVMDLCDIPKASAFRILETLRCNGYIVKDEHNRYRLTYKLLKVASVAQERHPLRRHALPVMEELHREIRETVNLGVLEEDQIVYAEVLESPHQLRLVPHIGGSVCFYATALGKAITAWLPSDVLASLLQSSKLRKLTPNTITTEQAFRRELARIREAGYAVDQEEEVSGCVCVASAVFDAQSRVLGGVSIAGPHSRMSKTRVVQLGRLLCDASRNISQKLGARDQVSK